MSPSGVVDRVNNRGPRTDPCSMLVSNGIVVDKILPILTKLVLALKYDLMQFNAVPGIQKVSESLLRWTGRVPQVRLHSRHQQPQAYRWQYGRVLSQSNGVIGRQIEVVNKVVRLEI